MDEAASDEDHTQRDSLIAEIIALEKECAALRESLAKKKTGKQRTWARARQTVGVVLLGRRLSQSLGELLASVKQSPKNVMGPEMARALDALSLRIIGRKRWVTILALVAAIPGIISLVLLAEQSRLTEMERFETSVTVGMTTRADLLGRIYGTFGNAELQGGIDPASPPRTRRDSIFALVVHDRDLMAKRDESLIVPGVEGNFVDISQAPLGRVDFRPHQGEAPYHFDRIGFVGSSFEDTVFSGLTISFCLMSDVICTRTDFSEAQLERVWFDDAFFEQVNFAGARIKECNFEGASFIGVDFTDATLEACQFEGATYTPDVKWPEGFDPVAAGAIAKPQPTPAPANPPEVQ